MDDRCPSELEAATDPLGSGISSSTETFASEQVHAVTLYLGSEGRLATQPEAQEGWSAYRVNPSVSTGKETRYQSDDLPPDPHYRADWNGGLDRLCTFTTPPAARAAEMTGYIELSVVMSTTSEEGGLFAYLEDVDPCGETRYITEGVLRLGFAASSMAEATGTPVCRNVLESDLKPIPPRTIRTIEMVLQPISWHVKEGHRIRLALGGTDQESTQTVRVDEPSELLFHHGSIYLSALRLTLESPAWD